MFEQLIVLGQIPGTTIQINFMQVLVTGISVGLVIYVQHEVRRIEAKKSAVNQQRSHNL